jgi:hypothetical protein
MLVRYSFILGSQNVDFLATWAEITNSPKVNKFPFTEGFYVPQVSINCLACPKGVKYKQISNEQAVLEVFHSKTVTDRLDVLHLLSTVSNSEKCAVVFSQT